MDIRAPHALQRILRSATPLLPQDGASRAHIEGVFEVMGIAGRIHARIFAPQPQDIRSAAAAPSIPNVRK